MVLIVTFLFSFFNTLPASGDSPTILSFKERARIKREITRDRLKNLLPGLMAREKIDLWIITSREGNEDPVFKTLMGVRRRTMLAFHHNRKTGKVKQYRIGKRGTWYKKDIPYNEVETYQWKRLAGLVEELKPERIAINVSPVFREADGMSHTEYTALTGALPAKYHKNLVTDGHMAVAWIEARTEREIVIYRNICRIAHDIIAEALSDKVVHPGVTTTEDIRWWFKEKTASLKLESLFGYMDIQRQALNKSAGVKTNVIIPGDLLHIDYGLRYLGLCTDTQQNAYVLKPGETDAPKGLKNALAVGNRLQDILTANFKVNRTGNDILLRSLKQARGEGIKGSIYCHPIGFFLHASGPVIGMWDMQGKVKGTGDYPLHYNTAYAIELKVKVYVPEWKKEVYMMLEEDAVFTREGVRYIDGRQTELFLIPRPVKQVK
jgi:hypothetical protein